jgi:uncharacterized membrane protein
LPETTHVLEQLSPTFSAHGAAGHQGGMYGIIIIIIIIIIIVVVVVVVVVKIKIKL